MNAIYRSVLVFLLVAPLFAQEGQKETPKPDQQKQEAAKQDALKIVQLGARVNGKVTLTDIDGKPIVAQELMGKITVVNFYSIQCPVQAAWDDRLARIQKDFEGQGVVFLHIDSNVTEIGAEPPASDGDSKPYANIRDHLSKKGLPYRVFVDHGNKVADLFEAKSTPHVFVFGQDGRLVYKGLVDDDQKNGNAEHRNNHLQDVLAKLTKGEKVEPFTTKEEGCSIKRVGAKKGDGASAKAKGSEGSGG